jgi:hypothetical protein
MASFWPQIAPPGDRVVSASLQKGLFAVGLVFLSGCVDVDGPTAVGVPIPVTIAAIPRFAFAPAPAVVNELDRARITLTNVPNDSIVAELEQEIDPADAEWVFQITLELPSDQTLDLRLDIELIDVRRTVAVVEYAGRTQFEARASFEPQEIREINLGRGPLENLSLTELIVGGARSRIQEGGSDVLDVDTVGAGSGQIVFFESTSPEIASVDSAGNIAALTPGQTYVIALAGRVADTLDLTVGEVNLPAPNELQSQISPQVDYVTSGFFLTTLADPALAAEVRDAIEVLLGEMLAGRGFQAVGRFEYAQELWEGYGAGTDLRFLDGPQLSVIAITLMHAADALGIDFL